MHQCVDQVLISRTALRHPIVAPTPISLFLPASGAIRPLSANKPAVEGVRLAADLALATDMASSSSSSSSRDRDMRLF